MKRSSRRFSSARLDQLARRLMDASVLCALATVGDDGQAHISHMYFGWNPRLEIFWISDPDSRHSRYLALTPSAAITIYDSHQTWGRPDRGIQLVGTAGVVLGAGSDEAGRVYSSRFPSYDAAKLNTYPFYRFQARSVNLFDERVLGSGTLVTAVVTAEGLRWQRTDVLA